MTQFELQQGYGTEPPNWKDIILFIIVFIIVFIIIISAVAYQLYLFI